MRAWSIACLVLWGCGESVTEVADLTAGTVAADDLAGQPPPPDLSADLGPASGQTVTLIGTGDIAECSVLTALGLDPHQQTAKLIGAYPPTTPIFTTGDNVYSDGTDAQFAYCYDVAWGQFKARTWPSAGNHDYNTSGATGYYNYFGARAGDPAKGYYSYDLGAWHIIVLNSNCGDVACDETSAQVAWLEADLAAHPTACTMAYWHHPRFSSDRAGNNAGVEPFYRALYDANADLILVGHAHNYERFAPQNPQGVLDTTRGIRQLVIGTGGADIRQLVDKKANSEVFIADYGIVELELAPSGYDWKFIQVPGNINDSGHQDCH